jgi:hypothetical protein
MLTDITPRRTPFTQSPAARKTTAVLCLMMALIHLIAQGQLTPGTPGYVGIDYSIVEVVGSLAGVILLVSPAPAGWLIAAAAAAGPLSGYLVSRGPGLPGYENHRGDWANPLGLLSVLIEGAILVLAIAAFPTGQPSADRKNEATRADRAPAEDGAEATSTPPDQD